MEGITLSITDEEIFHYIQYVERMGLLRSKLHGPADAIAFSMGASVFFYAFNLQHRLPVVWYVRAIRGESPFDGKEGDGQARETQERLSCDLAGHAGPQPARDLCDDQSNAVEPEKLQTGHGEAGKESV